MRTLKKINMQSMCVLAIFIAFSHTSLLQAQDLDFKYFENDKNTAVLPPLSSQSEASSEDSQEESLDYESPELELKYFKNDTNTVILPPITSEDSPSKSKNVIPPPPIPTTTSTAPRIIPPPPLPSNTSAQEPVVLVPIKPTPEASKQASTLSLPLTTPSTTPEAPAISFGLTNTIGTQALEPPTSSQTNHIVLTGPRPQRQSRPGSEAKSLTEIYSNTMANSFSCIDQHSVYWSMVKDLIKKPLPGNISLDKHFLELDEMIKKSGFSSLSDSEEKDKTVYALKRLYYLALFESKKHHNNVDSAEAERFAQKIIAGSSDLDSEEQDFRREIQIIISNLGHYASVLGKACLVDYKKQNPSVGTSVVNPPPPASEKPVVLVKPPAEPQPPVNNVKPPKSIAPPVEVTNPVHTQPSPPKIEQNTEVTTRPIDSVKKELVEYIYQNTDCRTRIPRNTRNVAFSVFEKFVEQKKGNVSAGEIARFANRLAYTKTESSGGFTLACMAETDRSHVPYDRMLHSSKLDWSLPQYKRFATKKVLWEGKDGKTRENTEVFGYLATLKAFQDTLDSKNSAPFNIDWVASTNFGINQLSSDRLSRPKSSGETEFVVGKQNWLRSLVHNQKFDQVLDYCKTQDFFTDSMTNIKSKFAEIAACSLQRKKSGAITKSDISCFASWMMLCPGLNFELSYYVPKAYFAAKTKAQEAVCTSSFEDILERYKNNKR